MPGSCSEPARSLSILIALTLLPVAALAEVRPLICPLAVEQERRAIEEHEIEIELAESERDAAVAIFKLVDQLRENDAVRPIVFLAAKHDRDVAELELKRQRLLLKRQEAELAQYQSVCAGDSDAKRSDLEQASKRYLQADCHSIGKELAIAEVDLAYYEEVRVSVLDLRANNVATQQDVIVAERDVEMARKRVARHKGRVAECADSDG